MNHEQAFLADIIEHPLDDVPRLVYADWLDDHDQTPRAEFIRLQCRLAKQPDEPSRDREQELLNQHGVAWAEPLRRLVDEWAFRRGFLERVCIDKAKKSFFKRLDKVFTQAPIRQVRIQHLGGEDLAPLLDRPDLLVRLNAIDLDQATPAQVLRLMQTPGLQLKRLLVEHADDGTAWNQTLMQLAEQPSLSAIKELGLAPGTRSTPPSIEALGAIIRSPHLVKLERLHLPFCELDTTLAHHLAWSPAMANLTHLDLGCAEVSRAGWEALIAGPNLKRLKWFGLYFAQVQIDGHGRSIDEDGLGERIRETFKDSADFVTSATFPRWQGQTWPKK